MGERSLQGAEVGDIRAASPMSPATARPGVALTLTAGLLAFVALPWNAIGGQGFLAFRWLGSYPSEARVAPAVFQLAQHGRLWFVPLLVALTVPLRAGTSATSDRDASRLLIAGGTLGIATIVAIALAIDIGGWTWAPLASLFGELPKRQPGLGVGALVFATASLLLLCQGLALRGWVKGDAFVAGAIGLAVALVGVFTAYPVTRLFLRAFVDG
ncbi:MAG TPA: iron ABC transporter permease, partial [Acidimicrobiia bacterium]|nr:iron ABC transporter permease [Acidimicrobiia bacterium]